MGSFNKVIIAGGVTRDVEAKTVGQGTVVASMSVAVTNRWKDKNSGKWKDETTYVDVTLWGAQAEVAEKYCKKGTQVLVEGRLKLETWDDSKTGEKRKALKVVAEQFQFLSPKPKGDEEPSTEEMMY